jgi:hypothetical protein
MLTRLSHEQYQEVLDITNHSRFTEDEVGEVYLFAEFKDNTIHILEFATAINVPPNEIVKFIQKYTLNKHHQIMHSPVMFAQEFNRIESTVNSIRELKSRIYKYRMMLREYEKREHVIVPDGLTNDGFCKVARVMFGISTIDVHLPELREAYTTTDALKEKMTEYHQNGFWYPPGKIAPRIQCLEKAIEIAESKLKSHAGRIS